MPGDGQAPDLAARYAKTDAGRTEIQRRQLPLSRPGRNLLLIIDPSRSGLEWLGLVQGADTTDLLALVRSGLVAPAAAAGSGTPRMSLAQALDTRSDKALYARITAEARPRLGLIKGYKLILDVERCQGPAEIRQLALRFVEQVRLTQGDTVALALVQVLLAPE